MAGKYILSPEYGLVIASFISTASILNDVERSDDRLYCVETHNDEFKWFENLYNSSRNPLGKAAAHYSKQWLEVFFSKHESEFVWLHVSKADHDGYLEYCPEHSGHVIPIGVDLTEKIVAGAPASDRVRLIFVGSLGVKMNLDGLRVFRDEFFPLLSRELGKNLEVNVVGSQPSRAVKKLCTTMGWNLHADISDQELSRLYRAATFSLLPFHYVTGRKLKILESLANGIPFLATCAMKDQVDEVIYPCVMSDTPSVWLKQVVDIQNRGVDVESRVEMNNYAMQFSWQEVSKTTHRLLSANFGRS